MNEIRKVEVEDLFGECDGFLPFMYSPFMLAILRNGGFIAGGFPRWIRSTAGVNGHVYFDKAGKRGDIDVFFRNADDHAAVLEELRQHAPYGDQMSRAGFARNLSVQIKDKERMFVYEVPIQLVNSHFGEPQELIKRFDLKNSMIGFDGTHGYVADGWKELEEKKTIEVVRLADNADTEHMLGQRIGKYMEKYGLRHLTPSSVKAVEDWFRKFKDGSGIYDFNKRKEGDAPRAWADVTRLKHVLLQGDLPLDMLPMFAGYINHTLVSEPTVKYGPVQHINVDLATHMLGERGASKRLIEYAKGMRDAREVKRLQADNERLIENAKAQGNDIDYHVAQMVPSQVGQDTAEDRAKARLENYRRLAGLGDNGDLPF